MIAQLISRRLLRAGTGGLAAALVLLPAHAAAATPHPGTLNPRWGGTGYVRTVFAGDYAFADGTAQHDGTVVAVGGVSTSSGGDFAIARYLSNGRLDQSFGHHGRVVTDFGGDDLAAAVAFQGKKIVVVGYTSPDDVQYSWAIARYNANGTLDNSFGTGGRVVTSFGNGYDFADAVAIQGNGILVAGEARTTSGGEDFALARYSYSGTLDSGFGTGGMVTTDFAGDTDSANGVRVTTSAILLAGYSKQPSGYQFALARYTTSGGLDPGFGSGGKVTTDFGHGDAFAHAVDVHNGLIIAVGSASNDQSNQDFAAAQYDSHGALVPSFGTGGLATLDMGGDDEAFGGHYQSDGSVVLAGGTPSGPFGNVFAVARLTPHGVPDHRFGGGGGFTVTAIGGVAAGLAMTMGPGSTVTVAGFSDNDFAVANYRL